MTITAIKTDTIEGLNSSFIKENQIEWMTTGSELKDHRESLGISIKDMSKATGTGETRLRNFERGKPISMANHLEKVYGLVFKNERLKSNQALYKRWMESKGKKLKKEVLELKVENEIQVAEDVSKTATAITSAFLQEHDLLHEFDMHLYQIQEAEDENSDEVVAVAEMMQSNIDSY